MLPDSSPGALVARIPRDYPAMVATALVASTASVLLWLYGHQGAPAVPIWDAWLWIAHARAYLDGGIVAVVRDFGLGNNEHLYALPSLIFLAAGPFVDYSQRPFALAAVALVVALGAFFYGVARSHGVGRVGALLTFLVVASFRHHQNLLIGFQFGIVLSAVTGAIAVYVADPKVRGANVVLALSLALISAASSAVGVVALCLVVAVRVAERRDPKRLALAMAALCLLVAAVGIALYSIEVMRELYFARIARAFHRISIATIVLDWARVMGGGLVADRSASVAGQIVVGWLMVCLVDEVRRERRISGLGGIALFSLVSALAIAWGRSPVLEIASRWAIFAAPGIGVGLIWLLHAASNRGRVSSGANVALALLVVWLTAANRIEAGAYREGIEAWETEVRMSLAYLKGGGTLSDAESARVNPGRPDLIRSLMQFYNDKGPADAEPGLEVIADLPSALAREATIRRDGDLLLLTGPGYTHHRVTCAHESGCMVRLAADVSVQGAATVGIIVRGPDGTERLNVNHPIPPAPEFSVQTITVSAAYREKIDPYVFCFTGTDTARIRGFKVFSIRAGRSLDSRRATDVRPKGTAS